jgi:hypothetical protein
MWIGSLSVGGNKSLVRRIENHDIEWRRGVSIMLTESPCDIASMSAHSRHRQRITDVGYIPLLARNGVSSDECQSANVWNITCRGLL